MPFTTSELQRAGKFSLEHYVRNKPIDQIGTERPWLARLMKGKRPFPGGKEHVVEQLRKSYDSNFQWYFGDAQVTYNKRDSLIQAFYPWRSCHDGYSLNEDELFSNGITVHDGPPRQNDGSERDRLTNLFTENNEVLRLGYEEKFDYELLRDGTQSADALEGIDLLVSTSPTSGTPGSIDRSVYSFWQNQYQGSLASGTLIAAMEVQHRNAARNGGRHNFIMMGSDMLDAFRTAVKADIARYTILPTQGLAPQMDGGVGSGVAGGVRTGLHFYGSEIFWNPVFEDLDDDLSPTPTYSKRCYMLNMNYIRLRPAMGHDMITRTPPRVYDRYAYYWGLTWKGSLCMSRSNAQIVLALS